MANKKEGVVGEIKKMATRNPLFLPPGSVRAVIALGAVFATIYLMMGNKGPTAVDFPDWWVAIVTLVVRDFFAKPK